LRKSGIFGNAYAIEEIFGFNFVRHTPYFATAHAFPEFPAIYYSLKSFTIVKDKEKRERETERERKKGKKGKGERERERE